MAGCLKHKPNEYQTVFGDQKDCTVDLWIIIYDLLIMKHHETHEFHWNYFSQ